jgi:hypothetical protein
VLERGGGAVWIEWLICGLMLALTVLAAVLIYG